MAGYDLLTNWFSRVDVDDEAWGLISTQNLILRWREKIRGVGEKNTRH